MPCSRGSPRGPAKAESYGQSRTERTVPIMQARDGTLARGWARRSGTGFWKHSVSASRTSISLVCPCSLSLDHSTVWISIQDFLERLADLFDGMEHAVRNKFGKVFC